MMMNSREKEAAMYHAGYLPNQPGNLSIIDQSNASPPPYFYAKNNPQAQYAANVNNYHQQMQEQMRHAYPTLIVAIHGVLMMLMSIVFIGLQVTLIVNNDFISYFGGGLWAGAFLLFTSIFTLSSSK